MIRQLYMLIKLLEMIVVKVKNRSICFVQFECMQQKILDLKDSLLELYELLQRSDSCNFSQIRMRIGMMRLHANILEQRDVLGLIFDKNQSDIEKTGIVYISKNNDDFDQHIIDLLTNFVLIIKKEFERERFSKRRACEIQRGEKEIEELRIVLQQLDVYLDFIQNHMPLTQKEIRVFIDIIILFFNCIACHVGFLAWLADFWVNCRFLQLHDE